MHLFYVKQKNQQTTKNPIDAMLALNTPFRRKGSHASVPLQAHTYVSPHVLYSK